MMKQNLMLINSTHPFRQTPDTLVFYDEEYTEHLLQKEAQEMLMRLLDEIKGHEDIFPISAYRSEQEQKKIWDDSIKEHGENYTRSYVALPGTSEHQSGLAIDLSTEKEETDIIAPVFKCKGKGETFHQNAHRFGFILRYEKEKEEITGIKEEPWHYRYVGIPHASIMKEKDFCLEEYITYLHNFTKEKPLEYQNYIIYRSHKEEENASYDNAGGYIITKRRNT